MVKGNPGGLGHFTMGLSQCGGHRMGSRSSEHLPLYLHPSLLLQMLSRTGLDVTLSNYSGICLQGPLTVQGCLLHEPKQPSLWNRRGTTAALGRFPGSVAAAPPSIALELVRLMEA